MSSMTSYLLLVAHVMLKAIIWQVEQQQMNVTAIACIFGTTDNMSSSCPYKSE